MLTFLYILVILDIYKNVMEVTYRMKLIKEKKGQVFGQVSGLMVGLAGLAITAVVVFLILSQTGANPTVAADVNASAAISISKTALVAGTNISLSTNTLNVDDAFLVNDGNDTTTGVITSAGYKLNVADGSGDVSIQFQQGGTTTYTMGIDDAVSSGTADLFKIHSDTALADSSDFIMDKSGNVTIGGDLTVSGDDLYMGTNTGGYILVADGTNFNPVAVSGDVTMASNGAVTIASSAVEHGMLAGSIPDSKLNQITTAGKVAIG